MKKLPVLDSNVQEFSFHSLADFARPIYLDNNATTQIDDDAATEMFVALEKNYANPSGMHAAGKSVKQHIEKARDYVANFIGCTSAEIIFTSGGTESINSVISSVMNTHYPRQRIITCLTEHGAVLNKLIDVNKKWAPKYDICYLDVDDNGRFDLVQLEYFLAKSSHLNLLVTIMAANNETGTIHTNIFDAIKLAHKYESLFHIDAVQVAGKLPLNQYVIGGTDFMTISGHKFHAPKGIGALYIKNGIDFSPMIIGGYQENNRRAGTENVPGIMAFGAVAKKMPMVTDIMIKLHQKFIRVLSSRIPSCIINGGGVPGTINVGFKYVHREAMVAKLSQYEVYASVGSACAKGIEPSHVLTAMKIPQEYIHGSVRFSFSKYTTEEEIDRALDIIERTYTEIRLYSKGIVL